MEQCIQTIKERTWWVIATLPFKRIPRRLKIKFVYFVVLWLNAFPVQSRISDVYSPQELLVRWQLDYKKHCCVLPGSYCEMHTKLSPSNTLVPCTQEAITAGPTSNIQGSVKFSVLNGTHTNRMVVHTTPNARQGDQMSECDWREGEARAGVSVS